MTESLPEKSRRGKNKYQWIIGGVVAAGLFVAALMIQEG